MKSNLSGSVEHQEKRTYLNYAHTNDLHSLSLNY